MTGIALALSQFWGQFGVPAYFADKVPSDADFPYITFDVSKGRFSGSTLMTAFNWHRNALGGNEERMAMADEIALAIPEKGVKLPLDGGGFLILYRNTDFQSIYQDPEDASVLGVRTSVEARFYTM